MLAAALAGLGNAPFHPVDFTILNQRVSPARLGHAFSVHGITGNLGWAAAPVFLLGLHELTGQWRVGYGVAALIGLLVLATLYRGRDALGEPRAERHAAHANTQAKASPTAGQAAAPERPLAFLALPSVWLCFSFFFFTTSALSAIQSFASPALHALYGLPLSTTAFVVTGYMLCGAVGMVIGGFVVNQVARLELTIGAAMALSATLLVLVGLGVLSGMAAAFGTALAGFGTGLAGPSRDMLIKRAAPPGATGRVYGTVYSGLDLGFAVSAPLFGALVDHGQHAEVFFGAAAAMALGIGSATLVGWRMAQGTAQVANVASA
jgi:MFS family permease